MKRMVSLLLTLVLALLLAGCGGNAAAAADSAAAPRDNGSGYWNTTADTDSISEDQNMAYEAEEPGASAYNDSKAQSDRPAKKVYTGYMEMQTLDFDKASGDIDALVKELGGYFQQSSVSNRGNSGYRYGSYTIRIPSAQFDTFLQKAGTLCHLVYSSTGTDDVSETYYDTEARLETARIKLERLQALLAKATSMDDIITIDDDELIVAFLDMVENHKMIVENSGLLTVAALRHLDVKNKKIVSILSGGNMDVITMSSVVQHGLIQRDRIFTVSVLIPDKPGELVRVASVIAENQGNVIKLDHNQFVSTNRNAAVELRITMEAFGTDHKNQIVAALEKAGCKPRVVRAIL